jgi:hypothetical protein
MTQVEVSTEGGGTAPEGMRGRVRGEHDVDGWTVPDSVVPGDISVSGRSR